MKKYLIVVLILVIILGVVCFFSLVPRINPNKIAGASLWGSFPEKPLESEELEKFLELYNDSKFLTFSPDYGTTAEVAVTIVFKDGSMIHILEFVKRGEIEISKRNPDGKQIAYCIVENKELYDYMTELKIKAKEE